MNLEPVMQSELSQKEKDKYHICLFEIQLVHMEVLVSHTVEA